jgi:hypothetical protein
MIQPRDCWWRMLAVIKIGFVLQYGQYRHPSLVGLFWPLTLADPDPDATSVFFNELDARFFERGSDLKSGCLPAREPSFRSF